MSFLAGLAGAFGTAGGASLGSGILSGLGQGLGSLGSSLLGGLTFGLSGTRRQMRKQQRYALEQMKVQNQYAQEQMNLQARLNREQYDYEYQKESPLAQRTRLEQAGLNAGLMYSGSGGSGMQGSVGTVSTPSGPSGSSITGSYMQPSLGQIANIALVESEIEKNKAQARDYDASASEKGASTAGIDLDNELKDITLSNNIMKSTLELDRLSVEVQNMRKAGVLSDIQYREYEQRIANMQEEKLLMLAKRINLGSDTKLKDEKIISERYARVILGLRVQNETVVADATVRRYDAQNELDRKRAAQVDKEIERIGAQIGYTKEQIKQLKHQRALNWAKFGVNTAIAVSAEARSWCTFGIAKGATPISDSVSQDIPGQPYHVAGNSDYSYMFAD